MMASFSTSALTELELQDHIATLEVAQQASWFVLSKVANIPKASEMIETALRAEEDQMNVAYNIGLFTGKMMVTVEAYGMEESHAKMFAMNTFAKHCMPNSGM